MSQNCLSKVMSNADPVRCKFCGACPRSPLSGVCTRQAVSHRSRGSEGLPTVGVGKKPSRACR